MDKSARLNVTIGIDMQIVAATSNTACLQISHHSESQL